MACIKFLKLLVFWIITNLGGLKKIFMSVILKLICKTEMFASEQYGSFSTKCTWIWKQNQARILQCDPKARSIDPMQWICMQL